MKQLKILYGGGFTKEEKNGYRVDIVNNLVDGMRDLVEGMATLKIQYEGGVTSQNLERDILRYKHREGSYELGQGIGATMKTLWEDAGVKECFARRHQLQILDCVGFFLDNIDRITAEHYEPTNEARLQKMHNLHFLSDRISYWLGSRLQELWTSLFQMRRQVHLTTRPTSS